MRAAALRHALGFDAASAGPAPSSRDAGQGTPGISTKRTAVVAGTQPDVDAALRKAGFEVRPVTFTPFDPAAAAKVQHFETYNRTAAGQRVADIVAALRQYPSAILVADGESALPALLAAAVVPVRQVITNVAGFDTASDSQFLDRAYIPGLRRAGDFQTAAAMVRGEVIAHGAGDAFHAAGIKVEPKPLTPAQIVALAVK